MTIIEAGRHLLTRIMDDPIPKPETALMLDWPGESRFKWCLTQVQTEARVEKRTNGYILHQKPKEWDKFKKVVEENGLKEDATTIGVLARLKEGEFIRWLTQTEHRGE